MRFAPPALAARRAFVFGTALLLSIIAAYEMYLVLAVGGPMGGWDQMRGRLMGVDGAPMIFYGEELGISRTFGFDRYELNFGKMIPQFKKYNSLQPIFGGNRFWQSGRNIVLVVKHLPLQVVQLQKIAIDNSQLADARAGQRVGNHRA